MHLTNLCAGIGAQLVVYNLADGQMLLQCTVFKSGQHVHGIEAVGDSAFLIVFGGRELKVCPTLVQHSCANVTVMPTSTRSTILPASLLWPLMGLCKPACT